MALERSDGQAEVCIKGAINHSSLSTPELAYFTNSTENPVKMTVR